MLLKRATALLVVALALPYACAPVYRFQAPRAFTGTQLYNPYAHLVGAWQRANLHAHGRAWFGLTSGRQTDEEVVRAYRARGYTVAGISDYFQIAANHGVPTLPLYEHGLNIGKHHQVVIGARSVAWFDLPLWQWLSHEQYVIDRVKASADLVALAHPSIAPTGYTESDLSRLTRYDLFEVVNGRFSADELWDVALSSGHAVWTIGDDDTHDVTDPDRIAVAWNMIDAPTTSLADIVSALRAGRTYTVSKSSETPDATDATLTSVAVEGPTVTVTLTAPASITFVGQNGRALRTVLDTTQASYAFAPADPYVRAVVRTPHTVMYLNPVLRYDGHRLEPVPATIDGLRTWVVRGAIALGCAAALFAGWRRPRRDARDGSASLRRASSFAIFVAVALGAATAASAQEKPTPPEANAVGNGPALGQTLTFDLLSDLPTAGNLFSVLETTQAEIISDRFSGGGVNYGTAARVGAFGGSWTQTQYRISDVNVTDGAVLGAPLFFPEVAWWERVTLASGAAPADVNGPGAIVTLVPRAPSPVWTRDVSASSAFGDAMTGKGGTLAVPIQRPTSFNRASVSASGPLPAGRGGLFVAGSWTGAAQRERSDPNERSASVGSAFANLVLTPNDRDEVRTVAIVQRASQPDPLRLLHTSSTTRRDDDSAHVQSTWQRRGDEDSGWRLFASFTQRTASNASALFTQTAVERLSAGPIADLIGTGDRTDRRWSGGGRLAFAPREMGFGNHIAQLGADVTGISSDTAPGFNGWIGERVAGVPARVWEFTRSTADMRHHATTAAAFASDRIQTPSRLTVDLALRYEWVGGSADGAANTVRWNSLLPRVAIQWPIMDRFGGSFFAAYERAAYQLPIDALSWGDPSGPTAEIHRWNPAIGSPLPFVPGAIVGRWGPGTGGDPAFSGIDSNLKRPYSDEVTFGIDAHPSAGTRFQLAALGKWDRRQLGIVNRSSAAPLYTTFGISDPGLDLANPASAQILQVSNLVLNPTVPYRYGFTLTNPSDATSRLLAVKLSAEARTDKLFVLLGATAGLADGNAPNQGFGPTENDPGVLGDVYVNPNGALFPRGRLFNDRAFTIKLTTIYKLPWDVRIGAIARYQDGQPFARLVVVPDLNQGAEVVRAFANGGSRFTYTGTLDVRLQKEFAAGSRRFAIVLDGFNIVPLGNEVEENVLTGAPFRTPTAVQPPPTLHVGARLTF